MSDHAWMELCELSIGTLSAIEARPLDAVLVQLPPSRHQELTTLVLQVVPSRHLPDSRFIYLNPFLYEFLAKAAEIGISCGQEYGVSEGVSVAIAPLAVHEHCSFQTVSESNEAIWSISCISKIIDLPHSSTISITCIYHQNSDAATTSLSSLRRQLCLALEGRLIRVNSLLALPTLSGVHIVVVTAINGDEALGSEEEVYRVGTSRESSLDVKNIDLPDANGSTLESSKWDQECPGYEKLLEELIKLSQLTGIAAPSGVLLTGVAGVGKTRLASCLGNHASKSQSMSMHVQWVSALDLLALAAWASESDLLELLLPLSSEKRCLLILDDLHVLASDEEEGSFSDPELLLVRNSILEALARLSRVTPSPFILGIAHAASQLPKELIRIGRLEKEIQMNSPTQVQREHILCFILGDVKNAENRCRWSEALAPRTAGCVASDLRRLCADAWTKAWSRSPDNVDISWSDLREAACVPSQLAQLDVTKTPTYPSKEDRPPNPLKVHEWSWRNFAGYHDVKKRLYRTVVMPWRRFIAATGRGGVDDNEQVRDSWVTAPSGVLFHGPPGVGKTLAASCLASSLELCAIKVRASDVLDQWLGGSEAAVRSLFARARAASPCILFFDEIDAIACNREDDGSSVDVTSRILTTFLNEMDGISSGANGSSGVLVVACTNRLATLDAALLRPGRLDEHVLLPMPTLSDVSEMLKLYLTKVPLTEDVNIRDLAELLVEVDASGADVEGICRNACSRVIREAAELSSDLKVSQNDFLVVIREWRK